jgi:hypothetical protein
MLAVLLKSLRLGEKVKTWWEVVLPSYAADKPILPSD